MKYKIDDNDTYCIKAERTFPPDDKEYKVVGWNIYVEVVDEQGNYHMEVWDIRNYISSQIDEDFYQDYGGEGQ